MAAIIDIHEVGTHLPGAVDEVAAARDTPRPKKLGLLDGKLEVPDDFNKPLDDSELAAFENTTCRS